MKPNQRVAQPLWVTACSVDRNLQMYRDGKLPDGIAGSMLAIPAKHLLRGIYGKGNFGVALILLCEAVADHFTHTWWRFRFWTGWIPREMKETIEDLNKKDEEC